MFLNTYVAQKCENTLFDDWASIRYYDQGRQKTIISTFGIHISPCVGYC